MLSSEQLSLRDPQNHCASILNSFVDDEDGSISYIVMPFLHLIEEPPSPMETVGEFLDLRTKYWRYICQDTRHQC